MMLRKILALAALIIVCATSAGAATSIQPAYRKISFQSGYPWTEGLLLAIDSDEEMCKAKYGKRWRSKCSTAMGQPGTAAQGIALAPAVAGRWEWLDTTTLRFIPLNRHSLKPDTAYEVDISKMRRPASVCIDTEKARIRTWGLAARLVSSKFWVDPSPASRHRVTASFEFNFPVPENIKPVELVSPKGVIFGKPELIWNENRDRLNISFPVTSLAPASGTASMVLKGFGQISMADGQINYRAGSSFPNGLVFQQNIPGYDSLLQITNAAIKYELDANLDGMYVLELETSLYTRPEDILRGLFVVELPKYISPEATTPYDWNMAPAITSEILKRGRKLDILNLLKDNAAQSKFRFRINPERGSHVLAAVWDKLESASGNKLGKPWVAIRQAQDADPRLGFMQPGNILPLKLSGILKIYASDLDCIEWEAQSVREPFLALVAASSWNSFESPLTLSGLSMENVSSSVNGRINIAQAPPGKAQYASLDLIKALGPGGKSGLVNVRLAGYRNGERKAQASRLILATNLGLMVKRSASGALDCFTQMLDSGRAAPNVKISILGANGQAVAEARTDENGHASIPSLAGLKRESLPVAAVASSDGDLAWLPLRDSSRELNYSDFNVGGARVDQLGLNLFVFNQRGIYRPGDILYFGCMARNADFSLPAPDMPLYAEITDPRGIKVWEQNFSAGNYGVASLQWEAPESALTGRYILNIRAGKKGDILNSTFARIEEFQPETLKIKIGHRAVKGWISTTADKEAGPLSQKGESIVISLLNLYGTPAKNHKIKASLETSPALFHLEGYEDFIFTDAAPLTGNGVKMDLAEASTDENGEAIYILPGEITGLSSATINIFAEGYEAGGGRAATARKSILVSPMRKILGYRPLGALTNLKFIPLNMDAKLELVALDSDSRPVDWRNLDFSLSLCRYVTSLVSDGQGGYHYDETPLNQPLKSWRANLPATGIKLPLDTSRPGEFLLVARDGQGNIIARIPYIVAGNSILPPDSQLAAGKMRVRLDSGAYNAGDTMKIYLSLPYAGSGLISIERENIAAFKRFSANAGDCVQEIRIPEDFEGKGYVVVSFARSAQSGAISMSPHTYAAAPFLANIDRRDMRLKVQTNSNARPGENLKVGISAKEPGVAVIFAVDEGILQLTGHKTPDPLYTLLGDRALEVGTIHEFDLIMPEHGKIESILSAFGGGMDVMPFGGRFENPFRRRNEPPVVWWSGLLRVGPDETVATIPLPEYYNGRLRIMAAGASDKSAGSAVAHTVVRAPLVITPHMPLAVSPGDTFEGALALANNAGKPARVDISVDLPPALELLAPIPEALDVQAGSEQVVPLRLRVQDAPGAASLRMRAACGDIKVQREAYISVRPANPLQTTIRSGFTDKSVEIPIYRDVYPHQARSVAYLAAIPIPLANGFARYLETYPFGCTEQLLSRSFAQLLLRAWPLKNVASEDRLKLFASTLGAVRSRFNGQGVSLWPDSEPDLLLTVYAADYLLNMHEAGIFSGDDILEQICRFLELNCALNTPSLEAARTSAYAIWVLTRSGRITTQHIDSLVKALDEFAIPRWRNDLTNLFLAASQKEMRMTKCLPLEDMDASGDDSYGGWFDEYARRAMYVALLARYFPRECTEAMKKDFYELTAIRMAEGGYATFSANQGIRAIMALAGAGAPEIVSARLRCLEPGKEGNIELLGSGALLAYETAQCQKYKIDLPDNSRPMFWQIGTTGYDKKPLDKSGVGIEIERQYVNDAGEIGGVVRQGEALTVRITARSTIGDIKDCVISDLLPGGLEMIIPGHDDPLPAGVKFVDRREDRMLIFADLGEDPLVFSYRARPVNRGMFTVPPVRASSMYDPQYSADGQSYALEVR